MQAAEMNVKPAECRLSQFTASAGVPGRNIGGRNPGIEVVLF
jgi:hypothetical protein